MANKKITDFAPAAAVGTSVVPVSDAAGTATNKVTLADIAALGGGPPGDATVTTPKLAANAVTYEKLQNVSATDRVLGRATAGAGLVEEIPCAATGRAVLAAANTVAGRAALAAAAADSPVFTGQVTVPIGTIAAPSITPPSAPSTGIYFTSNGIGFSFNGQRQFNTLSTGEVGINSAATFGISLRTDYSLTNAHATGAYIANTANVSVTGSYTNAAQQAHQFSSIAAGITNTGTSRAALTTAIRNYGAIGDAGTLAYLAGSEILYGHHATAAVAPTTTQVIGLLLQPYRGSGVITTMYDLFIAADGLTAGTATNRWAIYQANAAAPNYFAGSVGIGVTSPRSALDVAGVLTLAAGTANAPAITPADDTNTGVFFPATDAVGLATGGVERLRADNGGVTVTNLVVTSGFDGAIPLNIAEGRLTLATNTPVPSGAVTGATTLYYTPAIGNKIALYDTATARWRLRTFTELSYSLTGLLANTNYDVFVLESGGVLTLALSQWTNDSTRQVLGQLNGVLVAGGGGNGSRYVGTIRTNSSGLGEDNETQRFVWNMNNRVPQRLFMQDNVLHTWTAASGTYRPWRNVTTLGLTRVQFVVGEAGRGTLLTVPIHASLSEGFVGVGANTTTSALSGTSVYFSNVSGTGSGSLQHWHFGAGFHYLQAVQQGNGIGAGTTGTYSLFVSSPTFLG